MGTQKKEPQRYRWERRRKRRNPRDIDGNAEEKKGTSEIQLGTQKKKKEPQRYSLERRRRRKRNPRDLDGNAEEEERGTPEI